MIVANSNIPKIKIYCKKPLFFSFFFFCYEVSETEIVHENPFEIRWCQTCHDV